VLHRAVNAARLAGRARALAVALALAACRDGDARPGVDAGEGPPWDASDAPIPRPGMVWIPPGVLLAGTPPDRMPRVADEEMAGEQVVMRGFYIDVFPFPNEAFAIPTTNVTRDEAAERCAEQGKRLCTELEHERACKGPSNTTYEYGDVYKASICGTATPRALVPSGLHAECESGFGVHDLHGGAFSWTASDWGRDGSKPGQAALRGGGGTPGDLFGRCANARPMKPSSRREDVGFRCCAGEPSTFEVVLSVTRGEPLAWQPPDARVAPELERLVPEEIQGAVRDEPGAEPFHVERMWTWRPLGNEELVLGGGCARPREHALCGVLVARMRFDKPVALAFVSTDWWQPTIGQTETPREIWIYGGDEIGAFRKRVSYEWGRIAEGGEQRKKRRKGQKEAVFEP
jgi:hypothetical protein